MNKIKTIKFGWPWILMALLFFIGVFFSRDIWLLSIFFMIGGMVAIIVFLLMLIVDELLYIIKLLEK